MVRISIATTANCHDYKAKPTTSIATNATGSNEEGNAREGSDPGSTCGLMAGPGACYPIGLY